MLNIHCNKHHLQALWETAFCMCAHSATCRMCIFC